MPIRAHGPSEIIRIQGEEGVARANFWKSRNVVLAHRYVLHVVMLSGGLTQNESPT